jgi:AcrR family transcriptional regulator
MRGDAAAGPNSRARPDRRELAKADKLARIVAAATKLFDERGFEATTTAAITDAAGIGAGTLFLYVASKDDLLVLVFREELSRIWDDAFASVKARGTLLDQLTKLFGHVIAVHEQDPALTRAFLKELMFVSEAERAGVVEFMDRWLDRLASLLSAAQQRGALSPDVSPRALANNLWSLYFHTLQCRYGGYLSAGALPRRLKEAIELQLRGLVPTKARRAAVTKR